MTASHTAPLGFPQNLVALMRQLTRFAVRGGVAVALIFLAGMLAVATAIAGITLALVAVLMRLFGTGEEASVRTSSQPGADGSVTLEARKTPRGWTVE
ncbi:MAG: hypothetical protein AAFO63_03485 [Pseudomonadota bacterium]